uniref:WRKY domain-containing protein n=1 Tax=Leersia perrieri TaxID=77586 RepID=A0A0D9XW92_9ORYZ
MAAGAAVGHHSSVVCVATSAFGEEHHQAEAGDQVASVKEVAQVYELIKTHQPLLLLHQNSQHLAYSLLTKAMRALNVALSVMKHLPAPAAAAADQMNPVASMIKVKAEATTPANGSATPEADVADNHVVGKATKRSGAKRRRTTNGEDKPSWFQLTTAAPHEDGYQWRKYGEKKIQGTHFTSNDHTCNSSCTTRITDQNNLGLPLANNSQLGCPEDDAVCSKMIKQEPQAAPWLPPPPLPTISNNPDETLALHLCQEMLPGTKIYCTYELDHHQMMQQMETTVVEEALGLEADLDYPYFIDPQLLLLYEDLMNC